MATTTNYSWTTPDDTDLVKDGAAAIRSLGTAIDSTVFTNAGNAINKSIVDAAGDLIYGTADNTVARLALGTASQVLRVNSGATAPEWATVAAALAPRLIPLETGEYIRQSISAAATAQTVTEDQTIYIPVFLPTFTADRIVCRTSASHSGTSTVRLGIYNADATTRKPSTVLLDAGTVACNATSTNFLITINQAITAGYYYLAFNAQTITGTPSFFCSTSPLFAPISAERDGSFGEGSNAIHGFRQKSVTGAFATANPAGGGVSILPLVGLRSA